MKFVLAPDSFKETMTAAVAAQIMSAAVREVFPDAECVEVPMADGGEGTTQSLVDALGGQLMTVDVVDALGRPHQASFGWIEAERLAVVEIAQAAGLENIKPEERNPRLAATRGVGQLLTHVLDLDPDRMIVGLGGSATNDGGWGMARELGVKVSDINGKPIGTHALDLQQGATIDLSGLSAKWADIDMTLACDVDNPLVGEYGASAVFGPQKGVRESEIAIFDSAMQHWGELLEHATGCHVLTTPGAGAAGGLGAAFLSLFNARIERGIDLVISTVNLVETMSGADYVFTGEGSMDLQTRFGKTPWGVMLAARAQGIPTIAFTGQFNREADSLHEQGFAAIVPTIRSVGTLQEALAQACTNLYDSVRMTCRIIASRHS
ncbi:glycerate kinase [Trueperella pyogenes]|uniref:glycerate kinase n=1 Tax=Trueperella pyogenes TaxID=1661 RepID=UPI0032500C83